MLYEWAIAMTQSREDSEGCSFMSFGMGWETKDYMATSTILYYLYSFNATIISNNNKKGLAYKTPL